MIGISFKQPHVAPFLEPGCEYVSTVPFVGQITVQRTADTSINIVAWPWFLKLLELSTSNIQCRGRVSKGVGHLAHVWSHGVRKVVSSNPDRGNIVGWVFHPTRWLARFSLIWICLSFQILNLFRTLSSWWSGNYRPSAPFLYEVASHVK